MMNLLLAGLQTAHIGSLHGSWRRFQRAAADPLRIQSQHLQELLTANADTEYGRKYKFADIGSIPQYQQRVPIVDYDELHPWIQRICLGQQNVLTRDPVLMLEQSGGSVTRKLIPYTKGLLAEFSASTNAWLYDIFRSNLALWGTRSYWSVSPVSRQRQRTEGGIPIGFEDDTEYFGPLVRWALRRMLAVPPSVARTPDVQQWRRLTLTYLLAAQNLGLISVWSPTFLIQLMSSLEGQIDEVMAALPRHRALQIQSALQKTGFVSGEAIWPKLGLLSCWTDGSSTHFIPHLRRWFPKVTVQGKGLLATEGVISFPLWGKTGSVTAVSSHFLEFIDLQNEIKQPLLAHELIPGGRYSPVLSTAGGLYRYHLKDIVFCQGRFLQSPLLTFEGKLDRVSDLCGEKINAGQVEEALESAKQQTGVCYQFAMLAPVQPKDGCSAHYCLYIESTAKDQDIEALTRILEDHLATFHPYRYCRELNQLGPLRSVRVQHGWDTYEQALVSRGHRAGDIKPTFLDQRTIWNDIFLSIL